MIRVFLKPRGANEGPMILSIVLALVLGALACGQYPDRGYQFQAIWAAVLFVCFLLNVGWTAPLMVIGIYVGLFMDARVKSGTQYDQMCETVVSIATYTVIGFAAGIALDLRKRAVAAKIKSNVPSEESTTSNCPKEQP